MKYIFSILLAIVLLGCSVQVKTYQKQNHDFNQYESWCWLKGCEITYQGPKEYYDNRVIDEVANAIAYNMHEKGFLQGDDDADLLVNFYIIMKEDSSSVGESYDGMFSGIEMIPITNNPQYERFLKGSLIIDVIDRRKSEIIWRSTAAKYLEVNPVYDRAEIWSGVNKAMKKFPVKD